MKAFRKRDSSYGFGAQYPNDKFAAQILWREIQENFDPATGFVQRRNVRMLRVGGSFNPRPSRSTGIQQMFHDVFYTRFTRLDNGLVESWNIYATVIDWHLNSGDSLHSLFDANPTYERLFEPFEISTGVILPPGEYRFTPWRIFFTSAQKRRIQGSIGFSFGNFWSGTAQDGPNRPELQAASQLLDQLQHQPDVRHVARGQFHRQDLQRTGELCLFVLPLALQFDPVRQSIRKSRSAEPRALDRGTGERCFLCLWSGLGARPRARL